MHVRRKPIAALAVALLLPAGIGAAAGPASAAAYPPSMSSAVSSAVSSAGPATASSSASPGFYTPPAALPADPGALVRHEPTRLASFRLAGRTLFLDGAGTRVMYRSTDDAGAPVAVTGTYVEPNRPWAGPGPRPLVSLSVGTQGVGDACAPSKTIAGGVNVEAGRFMVGYELPAIHGFLERGVAVVVTDYVGLGTTDRVHTYTNREDMGHAVLDAARAAIDLPGSSVTEESQVGFYGYSQGGGAAGAAAELAPSYAPELQVAGAYVGGPPADLFRVLGSADGTALTGVLAWAVNGIVAYHPELEPQLEELWNAEGEAFVRDSTEQCIADAILTRGFARTTSFTASGRSASEEVVRHPDLLAAVAEQQLGTVVPEVPVLVVTGTKDDIVDHAQARQLAVDWCAGGGDVTYLPVRQLLPSGGTALNHLAPLLSHQAVSRDWLLDRFAGRTTQPSCARISSLP